MITNTGKNILAKYLIGSIPSYASYIAFGCGAKPLSTSDAFSDYSNKESLDFEMFRAPIVSRGYVTENVLNESGEITVDAFGNPVQYSEIVFTAEMPTADRYEITEVGVYSAGQNPAATANESRNMFLFSQSENWERHLADSASSIPIHSQDLYKLADGTVPVGAAESSINVTYDVFQASADDVVLDSEIRTLRGERPRFLNNVVFMRGDSCSVYGSGDGLFIDSDPASGTYDPRHIHLNDTAIALDKNSAKDEIRMALSVINKDNDETYPTDVKVIVEFSTPEGGVNSQSAKFMVHLQAVEDDLVNNRYFSVSKKIEELDKTAEFSWQAATIVKVYSSVIANGGFSDKFYVGLDAMRLENLSDTSPIYGLTGYTVTKTSEGLPIIKNANTANLLEFRFAMDVA
tara:strand:+ start:9677 stop:10888 length:1212 start_codon:yes stop_codon:yes gene_type:complete